ncbi:MAG: hypothetical protein ABSF03_31200 [Streptosporangiaceae bacterium]|jgi:hypothetical protein
MRSKSLYLAALAISGVAALVLGLVLADGQAAPQPVIAIAVIPAGHPSPQQIQAVITGAHDHQAGMLLLDTGTWQQAAATSEALSGYIPPPVQPTPTPICTLVEPGRNKAQKGSAGQAGTAPRPGKSASPSPAKSPVLRCMIPKPPPGPPGQTVPMNLGSMDVSVVTAANPERIAAHLPAAARVIDANGNVIRAGFTPGGSGLLVLLWGCLLLVFAGLTVRGTALFRSPPPAPPRRPTPGPSAGTPPPERAQVRRLDEPATPERSVKARSSRLARDILARYQPPDPVARWQPQCPRCGSFRVEPGVDGCACQFCGHRWPRAERESWPDVVVSLRGRRGTG